MTTPSPIRLYDECYLCTHMQLYLCGESTAPTLKVRSVEMHQVFRKFVTLMVESWVSGGAVNDEDAECIFASSPLDSTYRTIPGQTSFTCTKISTSSTLSEILGNVSNLSFVLVLECSTKGTRCVYISNLYKESSP